MQHHQKIGYKLQSKLYFNPKLSLVLPDEMVTSSLLKIKLKQKMFDKEVEPYLQNFLRLICNYIVMFSTFEI